MRIRLLRRGLTLLICVVALLTDGDAGGAPEQWLAFSLLLAGIPHGAADHLLFEQRFRRSTPGGSLSRFGLFYAGIIGIYAIFWWVLPEIALLFFLLVSVLHFGQTYYHEIAPARASGNWMAYLPWGAFVLFFPVLWHYSAAEPIISEMTGRTIALPPWMTRGVPVILFFLNLGVILRSYQREQIDRTVLAGRCLDLCLLLLLFLTTDLLLGFAVFFLLWHSLPAASDQWRFLRGRLKTFRLTDYLSALLPLSLMAFAFLFFFIYLLSKNGSDTGLIGLLFIFISLITIPHAILVDLIYARR